MGYYSRTSYRPRAPVLGRKKTATKKRSTATLAVRKSTMKRRAPARPKAIAAGPSFTMTKAKKTVRQNYSSENKTVALHVPARKPTAMQMIQCAMEPQWYRVQGLTQYDTSTGFFPLAQRTNTASDKFLPMHAWDVTSLPNTVNNVSTYPNAGHYLYLSSAGNALAATLNSQNAGGVTQTNSQWVDENISGGSVERYAFRKAFHHYTHIKLNLYGVRKRSTRFVVQLIRVAEEYADFLQAAGTNQEKKKLFDYLARPFCYNNLNTGDPQVAADVKILKTYECIVAPTQTIEYDGATAVPHIQTVNWFVSHNATRRYDWNRGSAPTTLNDAGFDVETTDTVTTRIDPTYRTYLLIRALSPEVRNIAGASYNDTAADPITEPSYDLVLRNKFSIPV